MRESKRIWIFSTFLTGLSLVHSQGSQVANVPVREVAAKIGTSATINCDSNGIPLFSCIWEHEFQKDLVFNFNKITLNQQQGKNPNTPYSYGGIGLENGSCGLTIRSVTEVDNAVWSCRLIDEAKGGLHSGSVHVTILKKPNSPEFSSNTDELRNLTDPTSSLQNNLSISCRALNGVPPPKFKWYIGNDEITQGLQPVQNTTEGDQHGVYQTLKGHKFSSEDNGKFLRCVLEHEAYEPSDPREIAEKINVNFAPRPSYPLGPLFVPSLGEDATFRVNISSNPKPSIVWIAGNTTVNVGTPNRKYRASNLVEVSSGVWEASLVIKEAEEDDLPILYKLKATNMYGTTEVDLRITSMNPDEGGLSAGGIVGLVLGIPALLIIIAVIVVYTRARGLLCFKGDDGTASEKERMDGDVGENGGTVPLEEKSASRRLSSRLSAIYENLVSKKKEKTSPPDEDANKEKEKELPRTESYQEKKPEDIVYAELDLVNEGAKQIVRCADDKTEYAEIVGTVPQGIHLDEPKKDKSPSGSMNPSPKN